MMERYFTLKSDTFLWIKNNRGLLYNSANPKVYEFDVSGEVSDLCGQLLDYDNLYTVSFDKLPVAAHSFVEVIAAKEFGYIWCPNDGVRHIALPPLLNLQCDYEQFKYYGALSKSLEINPYLSVLNIYVGGNTDNGDYFRQILYPPQSHTLLSVESLKRVLSDSAMYYVRQVNVVLGTDLDRAYIEEIGSVVNELNLQDKMVYHVLFNDVAILEQLNCFKDANISVITKVEDIENVVNKSHHFRLIVRSEAEFAVMDKFAQELAEERCVFEPVYDDNNQFFIDNILLDLDDLKDCRLSKREVFAHMAVNVNYFGALTITPDGLIYSDVSSSAVGSIDIPLRESVFEEMERNHLWRRVRDNEICSQCVYQWLCPSPCAYERVVGRKTICKMYK